MFHAIKIFLKLIINWEINSGYIKIRFSIIFFNAYKKHEFGEKENLRSFRKNFEQFLRAYYEIICRTRIGGSIILDGRYKVKI